MMIEIDENEYKELLRKAEQIEKRNAYHKKWRQANPDKAREYNARNHAKHREQIMDRKAMRGWKLVRDVKICEGIWE